ncbi:50S ribosomal protein L4 [Candidatus Gottesmanbacteria bacterium]|nr:50S ribosomal protein L4 [Candidatus Gottesmanbacteria bacterium]
MKTKSLSAPVVGIDGKAKGRITLPKELFSAKVNKPLLAQAVRVYLANQRAGTASTKTRGQVEGSTRKIYRQKGTGRARHGAIRAPIFVGGGIVFGPKPRDFSLKMPQKMKRAALASALTSQLLGGNVIVVDGLGDIEKTKAMVSALTAVGATSKTLLVTSAGGQPAARNIAEVDIVPANMLNAYGVLSHQKLVFTKDAIKKL